MIYSLGRIVSVFVIVVGIAGVAAGGQSAVAFWATSLSGGLISLGLFAFARSIVNEVQADARRREML